MIKKILVPVALAAMMVGPAFAGELDAAFGNTVRVTLPSGATVQYHYNADNTYAMVTPDGAQVSGAWALRGDQLCTTPAGGAESCVPFQPGHGVGDTWTQTDANGTVTVSIVAGR